MICKDVFVHVESLTQVGSISHEPIGQKYCTRVQTALNSVQTYGYFITKVRFTVDLLTQSLTHDDIVCLTRRSVDSMLSTRYARSLLFSLTFNRLNSKKYNFV